MRLRLKFSYFICMYRIFERNIYFSRELFHIIHKGIFKKFSGYYYKIKMKKFYYFYVYFLIYLIRFFLFSFSLSTFLWYSYSKNDCTIDLQTLVTHVYFIYNETSIHNIFKLNLGARRYLDK